MKRSSMVFGLLLLAVFSWVVWSCSSKSSLAPSSASGTSANSSSFIMPCGATLPSSANSASITLSCSTPMDLSSIQSANSSTIYACAAPSHLPQSFNSSSVSIISGTPCAAPTTTCSGPSTCSGSLNASNITVNCGDTLPCSTNSAVVTISCPTITDLSSIQSANSTFIYMHNVPCKLPQSFNSSQIILY
jgi:hypothetical protein